MDWNNGRCTARGTVHLKSLAFKNKATSSTCSWVDRCPFSPAFVRCQMTRYEAEALAVQFKLDHLAFKEIKMVIPVHQ